MDQHYVCVGSCKAVSDHPKACETPECTHKGQDMVLCSCLDGNHDEAFKQASEHAI